MRARPTLALHVAATLVLAACASPVAPPPIAPAPAVTQAAAPPPDPCARAAAQRARVAALLDAGKLDRALRVIAHADALCPATAAQSEKERAAAKAALDQPGEPAEAMITAALAAKRAGRAAEAQRLFDRAAARVERDEGAKVVLHVRNGLEAASGLPWKHNGGIFPRGMNVIVPDVAISHDGKRVAIADGPLVLVADLDPPRLRLRLEGHTANVTAIAWSSNDRMLASGAYDGSARVWDLATGKGTLVVKPADIVRGVRFLRRDGVLACLHDEASAWEIPSGRKVGQVSAPAEVASAIDPDGVVTTSALGIAKQRFDLFTGAHPAHLAHLGGPAPRAIAFTRDEATSVAAFADRLEIRRHPGGKLVRKIAVKGRVARVWIARDGKRVAAAEEDEEQGPLKRLRVWEATGKLLGTLTIAEDEAYTLDVTDINAEGVVIRRGDEVREVDPKRGKILRTGRSPERLALRAIDGMGGEDALTPDAIALADDGESAAVMLHREEGEEWPSRLVLLDLRARTLRDLEGGRPSSELRFLPGGKLLSWHYNDVARWDLASGKATTLLDGEKKSFGVEHVSADATLALVKAAGDEHLVIDVATGARTPGEQPGRAAFLGGSSDGAGLFFAQRDKKLAVLDPRRGKLRVVADAPAGSGAWAQAAVTRDGRWALVVERESPVKAFLDTLSLAGGPPRRIDRVLDFVDFLGTIGDRGVLVRTRDPQGAEAIQIVDAAQGTFEQRIHSDLWEMGSIVRTPDEAVFAAISRPEALVGLWSARSGEPLAALRVIAGRKTAYVTTPEGFLEIVGDPADVLAGHAYCAIGARVLPAEVCQERFVTTGILRGIAKHDPSWRDP